jgi:isochorismate hydrolase
VRKEQYFTEETLPDKARQFLSGVEELCRRRDWLLTPRAALLILDMQEYFLSPASHAFIPSAPAIVPGIQALLSMWKSRQLPVVFTRHTNNPQNAGRMSTWWRDLIRPGSAESAITPMLDTSGCQVLEKNQYDAFYGSPLDEMLRTAGITQVVICGVMTHLCCETTARSAFMCGFDVFFTVDGTATYTEAFHQATLLNLAHGFAVPVLVEEVLAHA